MLGRAILLELTLLCGVYSCDASDDRSPGNASPRPRPRPYPPATWILGPIYGTLCPYYGCPCGSGPEAGMADEVVADLEHLAAHDIPVTTFHFDGFGWSDGTCAWALGDTTREALETRGVRALVHFWGGCESVDAFERAHAQLGSVLGGFYLDDGADDALAQTASDWTLAQLPEGQVVMKAFSDLQTEAGLSSLGHACYVNDLPADFAGMREGISRVLGLSALLPAPFNEFSAFDGGNRPTEESFIRRLHWGALQVVMDHSPAMDADPWGPTYSTSLVDLFRYYSWLHLELVPYLHSYDYHAFETSEPIFRDPDATRFTTKLGEELFVAYVTEASVQELEIALPAGTWIDYWDERRQFVGPTAIAYPVPLGHEPIFIRSGAIIPMAVSRPYTGHGTAASAGSLTVLVYPDAKSSFRYRDDGLGRWVTISADRGRDTAALTLSEWPSQPVLFRIGRWPERPTRVSADGPRLWLNDAGAGLGLPELANEDLVNGSATAGWFYDVGARRLIVKLVPPQS